MEETLIKRRNELRKKINLFEWDKQRNQLHYAREKELKAYRDELEKLEAQ